MIGTIAEGVATQNGKRSEVFDSHDYNWNCFDFIL